MNILERKALPFFLYVYLLTFFFVASGISQENVVSEEENDVYEYKEQIVDYDILSISEEVLSGLSDEERLWYKRFQDGILFFDGWNEISQVILRSFPDYSEVEKKVLIQRLGVKIGTEWCKENNQRRIDTAMLKAWGNKIREAVSLGPEDTQEVLIEIENEVDLILASNTGKPFASPQS